MRRKVLACASVAVILTFAAVPARAIFGIGLPVFDLDSFLQLVDQLQQLKQEYDELVNIYNTVSNQYKQMQINATQIKGKKRWLATLSSWKFPNATNTYGTTASWISAINSGIAAVGGYVHATIPLTTYGSIWAKIPSAQQDVIKRNYATVELADGAAINTITALGAIRGNAPEVEDAIDTLENDSLSDSDEMNTEVGVLNKINAAGIIALRNTQDANKLMASALEQNLITLKDRRDATVQEMNTAIQMQAAMPALYQQHMAGATSVLSSFRLP
jgi:hypothetical protein